MAQTDNDPKITWLGHATFLINTPQGKRVLVDPWLSGNPKCPEAFHQQASDAILLTHGHADHIGDIDSALEHCGGPIIGIFELTSWLEKRHALDPSRLVGMNKGGTTFLESLDLGLAMTDARHSSAFVEQDGQIVYLGEAAGYVLSFKESTMRLYIAGDTCVFGDMALIAQLFKPTHAILPIGDRFTMGPRAAALAAELLGVSTVIPCHYGTFPLLTGTPKALREQIAERGLEVAVCALEPGQSL